MLDKMLDLRRQGFTDLDIAAACGVSRRTVQTYVAGTRPRLVRSFSMERHELMSALAALVVALGNEHRMDWSLKDKMVRAMELVVNRLSDLSVQQLRESREEREKFWSDFSSRFRRKWLPAIQIEQHVQGVLTGM